MSKTGNPRKREARQIPRKVLLEALCEIERQCVQADDPEHCTLSLVKHIARRALEDDGVLFGFTYADVDDRVREAMKANNPANALTSLFFTMLGERSGALAKDEALTIILGRKGLPS